MQKLKKESLLKPLDYVAVCIALLLVAISLYYMLSNRNTGARAILATTQGEWVYDLSSNVTFGAEGPLGVSIITLQDGHAFFVSSPCDNQICVQSHPIQHNGSFIACLPNQIFVRIESQDSPAFLDSTEEALDIIGY